MKVCRGMSVEELCLFLDGIEIIPRKNRKLVPGIKGWTDCAREICFCGMENEALANGFAGGCNGVVAVFDIPDESLRPGYGLYKGEFFNCSLYKDEYYLPKYSRESVKMLYWYWADWLAYDLEHDAWLHRHVYGPYWYGVSTIQRGDIYEPVF